MNLLFIPLMHLLCNCHQRQYSMFNTNFIAHSMHTNKTTHLSGIQRVLDYDSTLRTQTTVNLKHYDVHKLLKTKFYYLAVKMTAAKDGKQKAVEIAMEAMLAFINSGKAWSQTQAKVDVIFEDTAFPVTVISAQSAKLLRMLAQFDSLMTELARIELTNQHANLRVNYLNGFQKHLKNLMDICQKTEPHFHMNGNLREAQQHHDNRV